MKANKDIEEGRPLSINIEVKSVKNGKVYAIVKNKSSWPEINEKIIVELNKPKIIEHMGLKYIQLDAEFGETIFLPIEKWNEILAWIKEKNGGAINESK